MARPFWSGTIQISLVGFAVEIYPAVNTTRPISFREVDRKTLGRVHRQNVAAGPPPEERAPAAEEQEEADGSEEVEEASAKHKSSLSFAPTPAALNAVAPEGAPTYTPPTVTAPSATYSTGTARSAFDGVPPSVPDGATQHAVEKADIVKGYEYEKGKYAIIEPAELKNLRLAGKKTVEISQFSKATEINPALYEKPYFVFPKPGPQATAFAVVRQSMIESGKVGFGEIVFSGRQHLIALVPPHDSRQPGMMLYTLRFATELRDAKEFAKDVENVQVDAAQLALARQLIDAYTRPFEVTDFKDHYEEALRELVEAKMQDLPVPAAEPEKKPAKVIDLMEALRRSLAQPSPSGAVAGTANAQSVSDQAESATAAKPSKKPPASSTSKTRDAGTTRTASGKKSKSA
jgi:DNA end-binding protein Ku